MQDIESASDIVVDRNGRMMIYGPARAAAKRPTGLPGSDPCRGNSTPRDPNAVWLRERVTRSSAEVMGNGDGLFHCVFFFILKHL